MANKGFTKISREEIPLNSIGETEVDIYIYLPTQDRYVRFLAKGEVPDPQRIERLANHVVPAFFVDELTFKTAKKTQGPGSELIYGKKKTITLDNKEINTEVLGLEAEQRILDITNALLAMPMKDPAQVLASLEAVTDEIINIVAPEAKVVKEYLLQFSNNLELMNTASAITSISVLIAAANGFDSKKSYKELSFAALVMDVGMAGISEEEQKNYYLNPEALSPATKEIIKNHPAKSHQLATEKLPSLSETTLQLILTHHELYNGKGYPRGIRTETLAPIMKVLPLAVDVFEFLKRHSLQGKSATLVDALNYFLTEASEAHLRRHNKKIVESCLKYMSVTQSSEKISA